MVGIRVIGIDPVGAEVIAQVPTAEVQAELLHKIKPLQRASGAPPLTPLNRMARPERREVPLNPLGPGQPRVLPRRVPAPIEARTLPAMRTRHTPLVGMQRQLTRGTPEQILEQEGPHRQVELRVPGRRREKRPGGKRKNAKRKRPSKPEKRKLREK